MNKKCSQTTILLLLISFILASCSPKPSYAGEELWGQWAYTSMENGNDYYAVDLEFTKDGQLLSPDNEILGNLNITYKLVSPGNIRISALDESDILHYELNNEILKLYFSDGYNLYTRVGLAMSEGQRLTEEFSSQISEDNPNKENPIKQVVEEIFPGSKVITPENAERLIEFMHLGKGRIKDIQYSPNGEKIVVATEYGIYVYESKNLNELSFFDSSIELSKFLISPDSSKLALLFSLRDKLGYFSGNYELVIFDIEKGKELWKIEDYTPSEPLLLFSPNSNEFATVFGSYMLDNSGTLRAPIQVWDVYTGQELFIIKDDSNIISLSYSSNGKLLASASLSGITLWDSSTGVKMQYLDEKADKILFSPDSMIIVSESNRDSMISVWDVNIGDKIFALEGSFPAISPDGKTLGIIKNHKDIYLYNLKSMSEIQLLTVNLQNVKSITFSADGKILYMWDGYFHGNCELWDLISGKTKFMIEGWGEFSSAANILTILNEEGQIKLWDTDKNVEMGTIEEEGPFEIIRITLSPSGKTLLYETSDMTLHLWDLGSKRKLQSVKGYTRNIYYIDFLPRGDNIIAWDLDSVISLFDIANSDTILNFPGQFSKNSQDGKTIILINLEPPNINIWDIDSSKSLCSFSVYEADISPDGITLASAEEDGIHLRNVSTCEKMATLIEGEKRHCDVEFSPDGKTLAIDCLGNVSIWNIAQMTEVIQLKGYLEQSIFHSGVTDFFSPDGKMIALNSNETIELWDTLTWTKLRVLDVDCMGVIFSPDNKTLASFDNGRIILWDVETGRKLSKWDEIQGSGFPSFSPDGKIFSFIFDETVQLWDITKQVMITELKTDYVSHSVSFSPDGKTLAIGSPDGLIHLWNVP